MDVREKLVEILGEFLLWPSKMKNVRMPKGIEKLADHLIAHGVTVQENCKACAEATQNCITKLQEQIAELRLVHEWIPATEGLPHMRKESCMTDSGKYEYEISDPVFVLTKSSDMAVCRVSFEDGKHHWFDENCEEYDVTHWLSPPPLPRGE